MEAWLRNQAGVQVAGLINKHIHLTNNIVGDGLIVYLDPGISFSYPETGTTVTNIANPLLNATLVGGVGFSRLSNGIFTFDGVDDHITLPATTFNLSLGMTACIFANFGSANAWERLIDFAVGQANGNILFAREGTTTNLVYEIYDGGTSRGKVTGTSQIVNDQVRMYSFTHDNTTARLYVNNTQVVSTSYAFTIPTISRANNYIGRSNWSGDAYFQNQMGPILIYNRALSASEISTNFNALRTRVGI